MTAPADVVRLGDEISRTAQQVHACGDTTIHKLFKATFTRQAGHVYRTICGEHLGNVEDRAALTTAKANCPNCLPYRAVS